MAFNGSGVFQRLYNWVNDAAANIKIRADRMDNEMNGFATGLSTCITKDGQTTVTANLPMATFRHTGVGNATARNQYSSFAQLQDGNAAWVDGGGTADAITASYSIPITALVDGQMCYVRATAANATTTPTFSPSALTARTIVKNGGQALAAGDISGDGHELILRYDLANTRWELMNPKTSSGSIFLDNAFRVANSVDQTKYIKYDISGASTTRVGTFVCWMTADRNWTLPDETTTLVGTGVAQTLTNKTLTAPIINGDVTGTGIANTCEGRLTLTTGVPVTTSDVTGATSIYFTPYIGNKVSIYTGSTWIQYTFTELTLALGTITSGRPYDVFLDYNSGTPQLVLLAWTNDSTRATALAYQNGVLVKTGDTEQRYLGTFYTTATTTTEDSKANRYLWNYYNRVDRFMEVKELTDSWSYSTSTYRQANASTANQLNYVQGVSEDSVEATAIGVVFNSTATLRSASVAIGLDNTTTPSGIQGQSVFSSAVNAGCVASYRGITSAGRHFLAWLERAAGSATQTWYGDNGGTNVVQSGIHGTIRG